MYHSFHGLPQSEFWGRVRPFPLICAFDTLLAYPLNPLTPTVAIWVHLQSILCQTGLSRHL